MTAELSDIFHDRKSGVKHIVKISSEVLENDKVFFYSKKGIF